MKRNILYIIIFISGVILTGCDSFLDEMPDNRTEIDSETKIAKLLVSAYPEFHPNLLLEYMSDNIDDYLGDANLYWERFAKQYAYWQDATETSNNDAPSNVWSSYYAAIATANQALASIEEMGNPSSLSQYRGEALLIRAYSHFMLSAVFCMPYNPYSATETMGIPYAETPETQLNPKYDRGTLADVYAKIDRDLTEGLPLCGDDYDVPKYHFNKSAAYGFATRFYLFYQKYDKVIEYANVVLGSSPASRLRDWHISADKTFDYNVYTSDYTDVDSAGNLLMATGYSMMGAAMGPYGYCKRFATNSVTDKEVLEAPGPWGSLYSSDFEYIMRVYKYESSGSHSFVLVPKYPYLFQYTDAVQGIGYLHSLFTLVTGEEVLLNRAEAYALRGRFDEAVADLVTWQKSRFSLCFLITRPRIAKYYDSIEYYTPTEPTTKHRLHPQGFTVATGEMENTIHCILQVRRINFIHDGMRMLDCNRYGIDQYRRLVNKKSEIESVEDTLPFDDVRRAVQLPADVIAAGLTANPR